VIQQAAPQVMEIGFFGQQTPVLVQAMSGVDVSPPGHPIRVQWQPAAGASRAELDGGSLAIGPVTATTSLGALSIASVADGQQVEVSVSGGKRLRALTLSNLRVSGGAELSSEQLLSSQNPRLRLAVSTQVGGKWTPLCVLPALGARGVLPAQLTGGSYSSRVLTLPDPAAPKVRLALVQGDVPESFIFQQTRLDAAQGTAALPSADLELTAPDGAVVWAFPGELPSSQTVDLRVPAALALEAALGAGAAPDVTFRLRGRASTRATVAVSGLHGALVRAFPGVLGHGVEGGATPLAVTGPTLATETPAEAHADVAVSYAGVRLHDSIRDEPPAGSGGVRGPVLGDAPVVRSLPPAALLDHGPARVAPVGRAPEGCALSAELVDLGAGPPGTPLGPPGTLELEASNALRAPWIELPATGPVDRPAGVALRATAGRFLWAAGGSGIPLLRLAVHDPDPGGRPVRLGSGTLLEVNEPDLARTLSLPVGALRGPTRPLISSDLFCTVDLADLTLRYAR
jgi:hypothetical protein